MLERDAECMVALRAAAQIYHRAGRWADLIALHQGQLQSAEGSGAASLHCRIGRIYEEELGQADDAITAYRAALEADGGCSPALTALERLLRARERWEDLIGVLERFAGMRSEAQTRADALCRAAELAELHLGDSGRRIQAVRGSPGGLCGLRPGRAGRALRAAAPRGSPRSRAESLDEAIVASPADQTAAQWRLLRARVGEFSLNETPDVQTYAELAGVLTAGDRLRKEIAAVRQQTQAMNLATWLGNSATHCGDAALSAAIALEGAYLIELAGAGEDPLDLCRLAFEQRPDDPRCSGRSSGRSGAMAICRGGPAAGRRSSRLDPLQKALQLRRGGGLLPAGLLGEAARMARALRWTPAAFRRCGCWPSWPRRPMTLPSPTLRPAGGGLQPPQNRLEASLRAAALWAERIGDDTRAMSSLKFALATDPTDEAAFAAAEAICRRRGEFGELSRLFEQRIKVAEERRQQGLLRHHADLL